MTRDSIGWDGTRYWPTNTDPDVCQCVMDHATLIEGGIDQCHQERSPDSNRFCVGCEDTHGAAAEKRRKEKVNV
jgi:hypothetical protein